MSLRVTLAAALAVCFSVGASAATITVNTLADERNADGDCSLREAVESANTNASIDACTAGESGADEIVFSATLLAGTVSVGSGPIVTTEPVSIDGTTTVATRITISGGGTSGLFATKGGTLTLVDLTLTDANSESGSAVYVGSGTGLVATRVTFSDNEATGDAADNGGAAVYSDGGTVTLNDCTLTGNDATGAAGSGGAVLNNAGTLAVTGSSFGSNTSNRAGGAIEATGTSTTTLIDTDFTGNSTGNAPGNGGAFHITGPGNATISGGAVSGNMATAEGGGFWNSTGTMTISGTTFTANVAQGDAADNGGGAVFNNGGRVEARDITATGNSATGTSGSGGALFNATGGTFIVVSSTVSDNQAPRAGGGLEDAGGMVAIIDGTFEENDVTGNAMPGNGGAVHTGGGTVWVVGGTFTDNLAVEGGGLWTSGTLNVTDSADDLPPALTPSGTLPADAATVISGNDATGADPDQGGGGLYATPAGTISVKGATVSGNTASGASGSGGGIFSAGSLTVEMSEIRGNMANRAGGGIEDAMGTVVLVDVDLTGNSIDAAMPGNGGGLHSGGGDVSITRGLIDGNTAVEGGGLWASGTLTINGGAGTNGFDGGDNDATDDDGEDRSDDDDAAVSGDRDAFTTITDNTATGAEAGTGGGGIYVETGGMASIRYAVIDGNVASGTAGSGGGLLVADGASATVAFSEITGNTANRAGGGVELFDDAMTSDAAGATSVTLRTVTLDGNAIGTAAPGNGGGLHAGGAGMVTIRQSTVSNNTAREGAGVWISGGGSADIESSTVSGNTATEDGGGVYDNGGAAIAIASSTVALNAAGGDGGGLVSQGTAFSFQNTVVAGNTATGDGADCNGTFSSGDYNLVGTTAGCTLNGSTDNTITGTDPMLGPLADNGGFTLTHLPMMGSPLIDNGMSQFAVDQRGLGRGQSQAFPTPDDIGAVEADARPVAVDGPTDATELALLPVRPNPVVNGARLVFTVAEAAPARVEVFTVLGQRVMSAFDGQAAPGTEITVDVDVSGLAAGVYIVRLDAGGQMATQRMTVVR